MVSDTVQDVNQVLHNVGMAAWVGGTLFGRVALNPSVAQISSQAERGAVANAAWNAYNVVNDVCIPRCGDTSGGGKHPAFAERAWPRQPRQRRRPRGRYGSVLAQRGQPAAA
jgi:hypothetical protein